MNRKFKKGLAIVLALAMVFAMTATAFASHTSNYLMATSESMYHNYANINSNSGTGVVTYSLRGDTTNTAITGFTLKATPPSAAGSPIGFNSQSEAQSVTWTSSNTNIATVPAHGTAVASVSGTEGTYDSQVFVTLVGTSRGSCTIQATQGGRSVNFTIVLEVPNGTESVSGVRVIAEDYENFEVWEDSIVTVTQPTNTSAFYQKPNAAWSFASAGRAIETLTSNITVGVDGAYIQSINGVETKYTTEYFFWSYCVIRQNASGTYYIVNESNVIGAPDFRVQTGDIVFFAFAPESQQSEVQAGKLMTLNNEE